MDKLNITEGKWKYIYDNKSGLYAKDGCFMVTDSDNEDDMKAIVTAVNSTYKQGIDPEAVPELVKALKGLVYLVESDDEFEYKGSHVGQIKYDEAKQALKKAEL